MPSTALARLSAFFPVCLRRTANFHGLIATARAFVTNQVTLFSGCHEDPGPRRTAVHQSGSRRPEVACVRNLPGHAVPARAIRGLQRTLLGMPVPSGERTALHTRGGAGLRTPGQGWSGA